MNPGLEPIKGVDTPALSPRLITCVRMNVPETPLLMSQFSVTSAPMHKNVDLLTVNQRSWTRGVRKIFLGRVQFFYITTPAI